MGYNVKVIGDSIIYSLNAGVVKLVDTIDLGSIAEMRVGSTPIISKFIKRKFYVKFNLCFF